MKQIVILLLFAAFLLPACAGPQTRSSFDKSLENYNELIRWHELDKAALFAAPSISQEYVKRVEDAQKAKIFDYNVIDVKFDEKAREASAVVVYNYFMYTTGEVKRLTDNQRWVFTSRNGVDGWQLQSPLPEFR